MMFQAVRGMHDLPPDQVARWQFLEKTLCAILAQYAYREIRFPIVEKTALFKRGVGEVTDIVEKEMYTFVDQSGDSLSLRPEGTASCVRAVIEQNLLREQPIQRLFYLGPMFRHERPQKGRCRQFHHLGIEAFGLPGAELDVELILLANAFWKALGISDALQLEVNSLGSVESRKQYREKLVQYLRAHESQLDEDSRRRLETNPLRILDSKNQDTQKLLENAPQLLDELDAESKAHFERFTHLLMAAGIPFVINPRLVRGLDYYNRTVFEWVTDQLGAQGTVCAGGRYDGLVEQLGGNATPAAGFAVGLERLVELVPHFPESRDADIYLVLAGEAALKEGLLFAQTLRDALPNLRIETNLQNGSFKSQFKKADKSGASWAVVIGDGEVDAGAVTLKNLRETGEQHTISKGQVVAFLIEKIGSSC